MRFGQQQVHDRADRPPRRVVGVGEDLPCRVGLDREGSELAFPVDRVDGSEEHGRVTDDQRASTGTGVGAAVHEVRDLRPHAKGAGGLEHGDAVGFVEPDVGAERRQREPVAVHPCLVVGREEPDDPGVGTERVVADHVEVPDVALCCVTVGRADQCRVGGAPAGRLAAVERGCVGLVGDDRGGGRPRGGVVLGGRERERP